MENSLFLGVPVLKHFRVPWGIRAAVQGKAVKWSHNFLLKFYERPVNFISLDTVRNGETLETQQPDTTVNHGQQDFSVPKITLL